tara:strand:+ start:269 stop:2392 length:2124 start_codon:yes stop_codon:yes gene_type:complete
MAQKQLIIEFKPKGDKALVKAIRNLDVVTNRLQKTTSIYEKELKAMGLTQRQVTLFLNKQNKASLLGIKNNRLLSNSFATLRSKLLLVSFGIGLVSVGFKKLFDASIKQEKAEKKLSTALGETSTELLNYASALQKATTFGDEAIIEVQALIGAFTKDEEQIKTLTKATLDLAEAKGMDLTSAADLVAKSFGSSTNSLSRYGVEVKGAVGSSQRLESLTTNIAELFGGQAAAAADTLGGSVQQMTNAMGDANEAVGKAFAPVIKKLSGFLTEAAGSAREFFLEFAENDFEKTVRQIEEAGGNADDLKLSFAEMTKINMQDQFESMPDDLNSSKEALQKMNDIDKERVEILRNIAAIEEEMTKEGISRAQVQTFSGNLMEEELKFLKKHRDELERRHAQETMFASEFAQQTESQDLKNVKAQITQIENFQKIAKEFKKRLDDEDASLANKDKDKEKNKEILQFLVEYEKQLALIASLTEGDDEEGGLFSRIFGKFTKQEEMETLVGNIDKVVNAVAGVGNAYDKVKMQQINQAKQAELDTAKSIRNETIRSNKIAEIEARYAEKTRKHKEKMKDVKVSEAITNTALGITAAWDEPFPLNLALAALIAAQGAMQIKAIKAQKYQYGGLVGGRRHSQGGTMIEAEQGEFVMSRDATEAVGIENLNRMNAGLGGAGGTNIIINNPILGKDTIEDEIVPQIKEALRRGGSIA